jgi:hypothetical protein
MSKSNINSVFNCNENKDFQITYPNGYTISVQWGVDPWGVGTYSTETTAEVAIIDPAGNFYPISEKDSVIGWQTPTEISTLMIFAARLSNKEKDNESDWGH